MNIMKRTELWQYLKESKPVHNKPPDAKAAMKLVCDKMEIVECDTILETIRAQINYFRQFQEKKKKKNSNVREEVSVVDPIVLRAADYERVVNSPPAAKKVRKSLIDLCPFRKRQRTEDIYNMMKEFVDEENKGNDESPFTIRQLLGYLLHRSEYHDGDKKLSEVGMMLMNGQNILDRFYFDETDAVSLVHDMTLSKENSRVLKRINLGMEMAINMAAKNTNNLLSRIRTLMKNKTIVSEQLHAYIVPHQDAHQNEYIASCDNRLSFVSGFTGSAGTAIITEDKAALWTDGRYHLQASQQLDNNWTVMKDGLPDTPTKSDWLAKVLPKRANVGVDPFLISAAEWSPLSAALKYNGVTLMSVNENLVDAVWDDRPSKPCNPLQVLCEEFTGCSWPSKIEAVRAQMEKEKAMVCVFTQLGEIAYLFNMRGSDIEYNPVFFAYAVVNMDDIHLFIDEQKITPEIRNHLTYKGDQTGFEVKIHSYNEVHNYIPTNDNFPGKIWISDNSCYGLVSLLKKEKMVSQITPITLRKSIKNPSEIAGMRDAHIKDAVCLCEYFAWLEKEVPNGIVTEVKASDKLEEIKRTVADFVSPSFSTISSVGSNGAIIHYRASAETDRLISMTELYLCDSGSQYRNGTTDVTRTMHFGKPSNYEKECFTRVLKGHINLSSAVFPDKVNGNRLDILARTSLWNVGLDYLHGTGHGVGAFLEVHEGPCGISKKLCDTKGPIQEGMIITDEPGYYEEGKFGIRIENVLLVTKKETKFQFQSQQFLTFEPLTLVPIQRKMLLPEILTAEEKAWLNNYHQKCLDVVGPILQKEGRHEAYNWLLRETAME